MNRKTSKPQIGSLVERDGERFTNMGLIIGGNESVGWAIYWIQPGADRGWITDHWLSTELEVISQ